MVATEENLLNKYSIVNSCLKFTLSFIETVTYTSMILVGGTKVNDGSITIGGYSAFLTIRIMFAQPFQRIIETIKSWQELKVSLARLEDIRRIPVEASGTTPCPSLYGKIELIDVSFSYAQDQPPSLKNVSMTIQPGSTVAIVGPSGSGKTTLSRLLVGLHSPQSGEILFDGIPLDQYNKSELRNRIGAVLQESFLFDDTIRNNIAQNAPNMPMPRVIYAAQMACAHDFIETLPSAYETKVGEFGGRLSGGQRQRICLARAIAHEPDILLLDEATSSLDPISEAVITENLNTLACTKIIIAHKLSTIMSADNIFVLDGGNIVQSGPFDLLANIKGPFQAILEDMRENSLEE
jgi:ABC-type bacteriocin/lantibiotic exporter with double-glycine peptidase domain